MSELSIKDYEVNSKFYMWRYLDPVVIWVLRINPQDEVLYDSRRGELCKNGNDEDLEKHILGEMDIIDSKSSSLLTHVSIMLAIVAVFLADEKNPLGLNILLFVEIFVFSVFAALLLRCVDVMGPPWRMLSENREEVKEVYLREIVVRRGIYQAIVRFAFVFTFVVLVTVFLKLVLFSEPQPAGFVRKV